MHPRFLRSTGESSTKLKAQHVDKNARTTTEFMIQSPREVPSLEDGTERITRMNLSQSLAQDQVLSISKKNIHMMKRKSPLTMIKS